MNLSLNEVEATAKKAARGAGYAWGMAEEAAKATRWLCARDIDGCAALATLLTHGEATGLEPQPPCIEDDRWHGSGRPLCPLMTGAAVADRAGDLRSDEIRIGKIAEPTLLLPFAAIAATKIGGCVAINWPGTVANTDGDRLSLKGEQPSFAEDVTIKAGSETDLPDKRRTRAEPEPVVWATLERFASKTLAPATEESRLLGAGAGQSDND